MLGTGAMVVGVSVGVEIGAWVAVGKGVQVGGHVGVGGMGVLISTGPTRLIIMLKATTAESV
jgi:hypothetical protein